MDLPGGQTHRVIIRAMRGALRTLGDVTAVQPVYELVGVHRRSGSFLGAFRGFVRPQPFRRLSPRGKSLADTNSVLLIRLKKQEMSQQLGTSFDLGEGYGQIAARLSAGRAMIQMFQECCRRATGGGRTATSGQWLSEASNDRSSPAPCTRLRRNWSGRPCS